jgi:hypothetical protein
MRLRARPQRGFEPRSNPLDNGLDRQLLVTGPIDDEEFPRLGLNTPGCVEGDEVPPGVGRPDRQHADVVRRRFELLRDPERNVPAREQRLRVARGDEIELAVGIQLTDRLERVCTRGGSEREDNLELGALCLRGTATGQKPVRVLPGDAELTCKVRDGKAFAPQECLPNSRFITHGRRW